MSRPQKIFESMDDAGERTLQEMNTPIARESQPDLLIDNFDGGANANATPADEYADGIDAFEGAELSFEEYLQYDIGTTAQPMFNGIFGKLRSPSVEKSNIPPDDNATSMNNYAFDFDQQFTSMYDPAQWDTTPDAPQDISQNLSDQPPIPFDFIFENQDNNIGLLNENEAQMEDNTSPYGINPYASGIQPTVQATQISSHSKSNEAAPSTLIEASSHGSAPHNNEEPATVSAHNCWDANRPMNQEQGNLDQLLDSVRVMTEEELDEFFGPIPESLPEITAEEQAFLDNFWLSEMDSSPTNSASQANESADLAQENLEYNDQQGSFQFGEPTYPSISYGGNNTAGLSQSKDSQNHLRSLYSNYVPSELPQQVQYHQPAMGFTANNNTLENGIDLQQAHAQPITAENRASSNPVRNGSKEVDQNEDSDSDQDEDEVEVYYHRDWYKRRESKLHRMQMTLDEYYRIRPHARNQPLRDTFVTSMNKFNAKKLQREAKSDALEREGKPRLKPLKETPIKGSITVSSAEKDQVNAWRVEEGLTGRAIFTEKPQLRGRRKEGRKVPKLNSKLKNQRRSKDSKHVSDGTNGMNQVVVNDGPRHDTSSISAGPDFYSTTMGSRQPDGGPAHGAQGQYSGPYSNNGYMAIPNDQFGQMFRPAASSEYRLPPPSHVAQNNFAPQLGYHQNAPLQSFGYGTNGPQNDFNHVYESRNGSMMAPPPLARQYEQVTSPSLSSHQQPGYQQNYNNFVDPGLIFQAQYPMLGDTRAPKRHYGHEQESYAGEHRAKRRR